MNEPIDLVEQQLAGLAHSRPSELLREAVIKDVRLQLRGQCLEQRLMRIAAFVFLVGLGFNLSIVWQESRILLRDTFATLPADSLVKIIVAVSDVTDAETSENVARQFAALYGGTLSDAQIAELQRRGRSRPVEPTAAKKG